VPALSSSFLGSLQVLFLLQAWTGPPAFRPEYFLPAGTLLLFVFLLAIALGLTASGRLLGGTTGFQQFCAAIAGVSAPAALYSLGFVLPLQFLWPEIWLQAVAVEPRRFLTGPPPVLAVRLVHQVVQFWLLGVYFRSIGAAEGVSAGIAFLHNLLAGLYLFLLGLVLLTLVGAVVLFLRTQE